MVETEVECVALLGDGDDDVGADSDPDLCLDGVLGATEEDLDSQVLLDPPEEELDLPARLVELGDGKSGKPEIVAEELKVFGGLRIDERNCVFRRRASG